MISGVAADGDPMTGSLADATRVWRLEDVADAAQEIPLDQQPLRLRDALARLVEIPEEATDDRPTPADQPTRR